jgi:hypothetical protein
MLNRVPSIELQKKPQENEIIDYEKDLKKEENESKIFNFSFFNFIQLCRS